MRKRGRQISSIWSYFTEEPEPQHRISAVCLGCQQEVKYYRKSERVLKHLRKCPGMRGVIPGLVGSEEADRDTEPEVDGENGESVGHRDDESSASESRLATPTTVSTGAAASAASGSGSKATRTGGSKSSASGPSSSSSREDRAKVALAMLFYTTFSSAAAWLRPTPNKYLSDALDAVKFRASVLVPTRQELAGSLLSQCFAQVRRQVESLKRNDLYTIAVDGWSGRSSSAPAVCSAVTSDRRVFEDTMPSYSAVAAMNMAMHAAADDSAQSIAAEIQRIFDSNSRFGGGPIGCCTDNTPAYRSAWRILKAKNPRKFFYGCAAHTTHQLMSEVFSFTETQPTGANPFGGDMPMFTEHTFNLASFLTGESSSGTVKALFTARLSQRGLGPIIPMKRRNDWSSMHDMLVSLFNARDVIASFMHQDLPTLIDRNPMLRQHGDMLARFVLASDFGHQLKKAIEVLHPLNNMLTQFMNPKCPLSEVYAQFERLPSLYDAMAGLLSATEIAAIKAKIFTYRSYVCSDAARLAYLLDPAYHGAGLKDAELRQLEMELLGYTDDMATPALAQQLNVELHSYLTGIHAMRSTNPDLFNVLEKRGITALQYWRMKADAFPHLKALALRILSLPCASVYQRRTCADLFASELERVGPGVEGSSVRNRIRMVQYMRLAAPCIESASSTAYDEPLAESGPMAIGSGALATLFAAAETLAEVIAIPSRSLMKAAASAEAFAAV
jgi:hypothetical protein